MKNHETQNKGQKVEIDTSDHFEYASRVIDSWSNWKQELACGKSINSEGKAIVNCDKINK